MSAETRRVLGDVQGNTEVINGIKNISNKDQFFADVVRMNKDLNAHKLRISMTSDGQVNLNTQYKFNPSELSGLGKEGRSQVFATMGADTNTAPNVPTKLTVGNTVINNNCHEIEENPSVVVGLRPGEIIRIGILLIRISSSGAQEISRTLENLSRDLYTNLMTVSLNLLSKLLPDDVAKMKLLSPEEDLVVQIVKFVFNYLQHQRPLGEPSRTTDNVFSDALKEFFQDGIISEETILRLRDMFLKWLNEQIEKNREYYNKTQTICPVCAGVNYHNK